jgi:hypothetical protein
MQICCMTGHSRDTESCPIQKLRKWAENGRVYFSVCNVLWVDLYSLSSVQLCSNLVCIHLKGIPRDHRKNVYPKKWTEMCFLKIPRAFVSSFPCTIALFLLLHHCFYLVFFQVWRNFWHLFVKFLTSYWHFLTTFWHFLATFWQLFDIFGQLFDNFLTTFDNFLTFYLFWL